MHASDIMTSNVVTVSPETSVRDLAKLLCERGISGVPVVDAGNRVVGVVSEGDLLHRAETGTERRAERNEHRRSRWLETLASDRDLARDYVKSHGRKVADVMTRDVVTVDGETEIADIANLMEMKRIKRVPVIRDGALVGIVTRANLVRALATAPAMSAIDGDDRALRGALLSELRREEWAKVWAADVLVKDGVVHFWFGDDATPEQREAMRVAAENITGVKGIEQHIVPAPVFLSF